MIKCENGQVKFEGKYYEISADIVCVIDGITNILKDEEKIRQIVMTVGADNLISFLDVIIQGIKEVK